MVGRYKCKIYIPSFFLMAYSHKNENFDHPFFLMQVHIMSKHIKSGKIKEMRTFIAAENKENAPANDDIAAIAEEDNGIEC